MVVYKSMPGDQTLTWDNKNWITFTSNNQASVAYGTLCLRI